MALTTVQKKILNALAERPAHNRRGTGPAGMNLNALNKLRELGLVVVFYNQPTAPMITFRGRAFHANEWRITEAGRAALAE